MSSQLVPASWHALPVLSMPPLIRVPPKMAANCCTLQVATKPHTVPVPISFSRSAATNHYPLTTAVWAVGRKRPPLCGGSAPATPPVLQHASSTWCLHPQVPKRLAKPVSPAKPRLVPALIPSPRNPLPSLHTPVCRQPQISHHSPCHKIPAIRRKRPPLCGGSAPPGPTTCLIDLVSTSQQVPNRKRLAKPRPASPSKAPQVPALSLPCACPHPAIPCRLCTPPNAASLKSPITVNPLNPIKSQFRQSPVLLP